MTENDVLDKGGQAVIWTILRIVLAIYLVVGFFVYLRSDHRVVDPSDQPEGQRSSQKGTFLPCSGDFLCICRREASLCGQNPTMKA